MRRARVGRAIALTGLIAAASLATGLLSGSAELPAADVLVHLFTDDGSVANRIVDDLRLPRTLTAFAVGGLLALAGTLIQVMLRNPLGDPYLLGVSGGASFAALLAMLLALPQVLLTPVAFIGAGASTLLVFGLAKHGDDWRSERLLLTGVVVAAGWAAAISFVLSTAPTERLPGMLFWLMGDLGGQTRPTLPLLLMLAGLGVAMLRARDLNVATRGLEHAATLGVDPRRLRLELYFASALLTAAAVSVAGAIGFVGLVTPHIARRLGYVDHRLLLPAATLLGGALLVFADAVARTLISPMQLPVGVLTAMVGVPLFLFLLNRRPRP